MCDLDYVNEILHSSEAKTWFNEGSVIVNTVFGIHRAFPGFFAKAPVRGRKRFQLFSKAGSSCVRTVSLQFYLLNKPMEKTPETYSEMTLLLAGMGKRTVILPEATDHFEVNLKK